MHCSESQKQTLKSCQLHYDDAVVPFAIIAQTIGSNRLKSLSGPTLTNKEFSCCSVQVAARVKLTDCLNC